MPTRLAAVLCTFVLVGCVTTAADDSDPALDGKADGESPTALGALAWGTPADLAFGDATLLYMTFELSGDAEIALETTRGSTGLDTILYVYAPTGDRWGAYLSRNDNGGAGKLSKISMQLGAGAYRVLVRRRSTGAGESAQLLGTCTGTGCTPPQHGCTPLAPRTAAPTVFVGPTNWQAGIESAIDSATTSLDVQMYLFTVTDIADHIIAAQGRGVAVRVLLDPHEDNSVVQGKLTAAGVANQTDPMRFSYAHAKYMIIDRTTAVIQSGNFNVGAVQSERNYAVVDRDLDDVADLQSIFDADWTNGPDPDLSCTRLIVSPINSAQRIVDHVNTAKATLDIEVLYLTETNVRDAIVAASQRGVAVRIMLSDPARNPVNTQTQAYFVGQSIPTKILTTNYLHTKMIQADGVALVGSENMSTTSLTMNREVGVLVAEPSAAGVIHTQYEADWAAAR